MATKKAPSNGKEAPAKEAAPEQMVQPQRPAGLKAMTEQDVNAYMESLMQAQQPPPGMEAMELGALTQFRGANEQLGVAERKLTRAQRDVEELRSQIAQLQGQSTAYVNLLVMAEDARRAEAQTE
jgi:hypothetical protein